jgi:DNA-binding winged helix-turn-helix (wHTH) protein
MSGQPELRHAPKRFGVFELNPETGELRKHGISIRLQDQPLKVLLCLLERPGFLCSRESLIRSIWNEGTFVDYEHGLNAAVTRLRQVLGDSADHPRYIETVGRKGYRFIAPVESTQATEPFDSAAHLTEFVSAKSGAEIGGPGSETPSAESTEMLLPRAMAVRSRRNALLATGFLTSLIGSFVLGQYFAKRAPTEAMRFTAISNFSGVEAQPAFSPDGRSVAFVSDRGGQSDVWVGLPGGGNLVRVTNDSNAKARPRWSPDGSKLLYARLNESGLWDSWVVPVLGGPARMLISNAADPTWSPDGRSIAYANLSSGTIWTCNAAGRDLRALTDPDPNVRHRQPAFSRDGHSIGSFWHPSPRPQFDLHPDGHRIVIDAFELHQADISMIENVQ